MLRSVKAPEQFAPLFEKAEQIAEDYFREKREDPSQGTIEMRGERYILVRGASLSVDFFEAVRGMYEVYGHEQADAIAQRILYDVAHAIGKSDARNFHKKMGLVDPVEKMSVGPVLFSHLGWAFVDIFPESRPSPDENYFLIYDHPYSFEADAWGRAGKRSYAPACVMNAGYSSGWCEESFGISLVATELTCKAMGADACRFIMSHPSKLDEHLKWYFETYGAQAASKPISHQGGLHIQDLVYQGEAMFRAVLESVSEGLLAVDREGRITHANKRFAAMWGLPAEVLESRDKERIFEAIVPQVNDAELWLGSFEQLRGSIQETSDTFTCKDGRLIERVSFPLLRMGKVSGRVWSFKDVTLQKQMETELRESEEKFRAISSSALDGIIMVEPDGEISFWNSAAETIFGWSAEDALGKDFLKLVIPSRFYEMHNKTLLQFLEDSAFDASGQILELIALHKSGTEFPIEISLAKFHLQNGWHIVGIVRDITERKRTEAELRKAKEAAEVAVKAKSFFLANMSHEIRTPMNGIIGMSSLLLETPLSREQREFVQTVDTCAKSLLSVINDILDFSKIEAGKLDFEVMDFDLRTTLDELNDILAMRAQEKGLEYVCTIEHDVPSLLRGDPGRLRQILTNLVGNAIKFTPKGEVVIHTSLEKEDDEQAMVRFEVRDTGIGLSSDRFDTIFDAFVQADTSTTRKYGGTGLGLSISRQLVEMMGGEIHVQSREHEGSTFWFTIQFIKQKMRKDEKQSYTHEEIDTLEHARILIVDDNATNRLVLSKQLESWGCRYEEASSAKEALARLHLAMDENNPFEIVITDMQMPEMDGFMLGEKILHEPTLQNTLLVMMTSIGQRGDGERFEKAGFAAYLTKPVKQSQLFDCLITLVNKKHAESTGQTVPFVTRHVLTEQKKRKIRILIAEDNPTNQLVAIKILERAGYSANAVANGLEAVNALETTPYDIVLMDLQMPEMDGFEATTVIRDSRSKVCNHAIPIIAMTAHAMKGDREKCLEAGMNDYVSKPVSPKELISAIERYLNVSDSTGKEPLPIRSSNAVLDMIRLRDSLDNDKEMIKEILQTFIDDAPNQLAKLREAVEQGDAQIVERQAHSLKGASANIGAVSMRETALRLEMLGREKNLQTAMEILDELNEEFTLVKDAIDNEMK